jgi:iron complex transport system substrate-binding protein
MSAPLGALREAREGTLTRVSAIRESRWELGTGAQTGMSVLRGAQAEAGSPLRSVVDETGRRVEVPVRVERVVSLAPNVTDILYALGAGDKIAGVTDFTDTPAGTARKPSVGQPVEPNLERIAALRPDLVFVAAINRWETVQSLEGLGIPVYGTDSQTVEGMLETVRQIGALVGKEQAGEELAGSLEARLDALRVRLAGRAKKRVFYVVWLDPLITTGRNTFIADALRWAGARQVPGLRQDWPHVSLEEVVARQPEYLIFPEAQNEKPEEIVQSLKQLAGWRDLEAVKKGNVVVLSDAINRQSPALVDAIEELARRLHPGAFSQQAGPKNPAPWHGTGEAMWVR